MPALVACNYLTLLAQNLGGEIGRGGGRDGGECLAVEERMGEEGGGRRTMLW
jgi:hypothetical protein